MINPSINVLARLSPSNPVLARHKKRMQTFMAEGLPEFEASELADEMLERDRRGAMDDRRVCFECRNFVHRHCTAITDKFGRPTKQLVFILQRCKKFDLKGKK